MESTHRVFAGTPPSTLLMAMVFCVPSGCESHVVDSDAPIDTDDRDDHNTAETHIENEVEDLVGSKETNGESEQETGTGPHTPVWIAPRHVESTLPCTNHRIPFTFSPRQLQYSVENSFWMMWASFRAFQSDRVETIAEFSSIDFHRYKAFDNAATGLQAYMTASDDGVLLAFRGSIELADWLANFNFPLRDGEPIDQPGRVHKGISKVLEKSWGELEATLDDYASAGQTIWVTGHSLGGALATLAASKLARLGYAVGPVYTFASPRVGDRTYAEETWKLLGEKHYRFVHGNDLVPRLPPSAPAAGFAAEVLPVGLGRNVVTALLTSLDYAHSGIMLLMGNGTELLPFPAFDETDDITYWSIFSQKVEEDGILDFFENQDQDALHNERTYMCKLATLYLGSN